LASINANDNEFVNIATSFYYQKTTTLQPHADMEKFYMHTCNGHDE